MAFIKVTAIPCSPEGKYSAQVNSVLLILNTDLIGAVKGNEVFMKNGNVMQLGENYYTKFFLQIGSALPVL